MSAPAGAGAARWWHGRAWAGAVGVGRWVLLAVVVGTALPGALHGGAAVVPAVAVVVGAACAVATGSAHRGFPSTPAGRRAVVYAGAGGALSVPFLVGAVSLGAAGGALVLATTTLAAVLAGDWLCALDGRAATWDARRPERLRRLVGLLSTDELVAEWLVSEAALGVADVPALARLVRCREVLLDELLRRDPQRTAALLAEGAGRGPQLPPPSRRD
ncbi:hypothetical protein [Modestobacter sp. NPDC049651]|uniref:hypothetical protein n=1 Tax=unclassified Modestobacter TaxID=2643866 RepID=UPI0033EF9213